jgi:thioredoxin 1
MAKEITDNLFEEKVIKSSKPVLIDFWASWCGPCKQLAPTIDDISQELANDIDVYKCNIDENPETPSKYAVRGIPTLILFKDGQVVDTKVGNLPKSNIVQWIKDNS